MSKKINKYQDLEDTPSPTEECNSGRFHRYCDKEDEIDIKNSSNDLIHQLLKKLQIAQKSYTKFDGIKRGHEAKSWLHQFDSEFNEFTMTTYVNLLKENLEGDAHKWAEFTCMDIKSKEEFNSLFLETFAPGTESNALEVVKHINKGCSLKNFVAFITEACILRKNSYITFRDMCDYIEDKFKDRNVKVVLTDIKNEQKLIQKAVEIQEEMRRYLKIQESKFKSRGNDYKKPEYFKSKEENAKGNKSTSMEEKPIVKSSEILKQTRS